MSKQITKVKYDGSKVQVAWEEDTPIGKNEFFLKCSDAPRADFSVALQLLKKYVTQIIEIPEENQNKWIENLEIRGVSFSWTNNVMGAVITALKTLEKSNSPLVINTPHKTAEPYSPGGDVGNLLSEECVDALKDVIFEAEEYIGGKRAQQTMLEK